MGIVIDLGQGASNAETPLERTISFLKGLGVTDVYIHFSGGNDEGGPDSIEGYKADKTEVKITTDIHAYQQGGGNWVAFDKVGGCRPATPEEITSAEIQEVLCQPIYNEYHSFAGEFYVEGELHWDIDNEMVYMKKSEQVPTWETTEEEWDMNNLPLGPDWLH